MSNILKRVELVKRETFDPANAEHIESMRVYVRTGNWGNVQFYPEVPYIEVPMTVLMKYAAFSLGVSREDSSEREARLSTRPRVTEPVLSRSQQAAAQTAKLAKSNKLLSDQLSSL